jgi:hypothetical protein
MELNLKTENLVYINIRSSIGMHKAIGSDSVRI